MLKNLYFIEIEIVEHVISINRFSIVQTPFTRAILQPFHLYILAIDVHLF